MKRVKAGVVVFPGSNCDHDAFYALKHILGNDVDFLWHKEKLNAKYDLIILPGGFSYGDYPRTGAIAKFSPIMDNVVDFAEKGGTLMGICNGFQILTESGLLPGVLVRNESLRFVCKDTFLKIENPHSRFTDSIKASQTLKIPVAHGDGCYFASPDIVSALYENHQVIFRYCSPDGEIDEISNPNGSVTNIAGIINKKGNVLGMMPHPERCCDPVLGNSDGSLIFNSILRHL